jgi:hypothetical protein
MPQTPLRVAVHEDKQIKPDSHDREPEAAGSSGNEPLFDIDEAPNPENLAGYKDQEQGEDDQLETAEFVGTCDQECNTSKDQ